MSWRYTNARSTQDELMDSEPVSFAEFQDCLRELATINRWTFAYPPTLRWLRQVISRLPKSQATISLFDIGSGGGDMLRRIMRDIRLPGRSLQLTGIDLNPWSKASAEGVDGVIYPDIQHETVDIFDIDPARRVDFIISSLFTHHLRDAELVRFICWMESHATHGWLINDLHRHWLPYHFIKYAVRLCSRNRLIVHDAPVSVARAFRRRDWQRLLNEAGVGDTAVIRWVFPFRYIITRRK